MSIPGGGLRWSKTHCSETGSRNQLVKRLLPKATQLPSACTMYWTFQCAVRSARRYCRLRRRVEDSHICFSTRAFLNVIVKSPKYYLPMPRVDMTLCSHQKMPPRQSVSSKVTIACAILGHRQQRNIGRDLHARGLSARRLEVRLGARFCLQFPRPARDYRKQSLNGLQHALVE